MKKLVTYLHPQTCQTSKPIEAINFCGHSFPYFAQVRRQLEIHLKDLPSLKVRKARYEDYKTVHDQIYLKKIALSALDRPLDKSSLSLPLLGGECQGLEYCIPAYLYGLGGMLEALECMKKGIIERAYCFSLVGHHAHTNWGHGYCLLNPLAAAARYAQKVGFQKVLIIDWDVHHGDGTQNIFANDDSVYCISIHSAIDFYMAKVSDLKAGTTIKAQETGHCNIPLLDKTTYPPEVLRNLELAGEFYSPAEGLSAFRNSLYNLPWKPDLILIFSGYDSHQEDCGGNVTNWTDETFRMLTQWVLDLAKQSSCPVLSSHGGGYKLNVTIKAALEHIKALGSF